MYPREGQRLITLGAAIRTICVLALASVLADCGGHSNPITYTTSYTTSITNYTVGGTIRGLTMGSVVLANGTATVTVAANANSWVFPASFTPGSSYSVTVQTQPTAEACTVVSGGSGMNTGNVSNVIVECGFGQWTSKAGATLVNAAGVYGTQGTAAAGNTPGARYWTNSWTDASGNFWLFGGVGNDSAGNAGYLNDLWQYSPSTGLWTWISGSNTVNATGVYGTLGTPAASNVPGARQASISWTDPSGNLWLFGGVGYSSSGAVGELNDLWRYSPTSGQWTWISGSSTVNAMGSYGTQGTPAASNVPGARQGSISWTDPSGNLWLFGGIGYASTPGQGELNDLWQYSPSSGQWTWISGGSGLNAAGNYGTEDLAATTNVPGARYSAISWIDSAGNLWLFGGYGYDSASSVGKLNDLWRYAPGTAEWTWISGEDAANATGVYGTLGTPEVGNEPGARQGASSWMDSSGNLWLFGGLGYDSAGAVGNQNDLWQYNVSTGLWAWVSGESVHNTAGVYGTQGTGSVANAPGARNSISSWMDSSGNLWLFGGSGYDSTGTFGYLNDLWQYTPGSIN
jgi:N-acetylneuraminic acid mutarotase